MSPPPPNFSDRRDYLVWWLSVYPFRAPSSLFEVPGVGLFSILFCLLFHFLFNFMKKPF